MNNTKDRLYKIKNLIKELPTYVVLMKRKVNGITTNACPRCNKFREDWDHVWTCEVNEIEIDSLIKKSICESTIVNTDSEKRIWELLRGVYNDNFNKISKSKDTKKVVENLCIFCYGKIRSTIWNTRFELVVEIEKEQGLIKSELRNKRKKSVLEGNFDETEDNGKLIENRKTNENVKNPKKLVKKIKLVTKDRMIGRIMEGISIKNNWHTITKLAY
ncbi:unnamed protein product [Rhizophagus irregularis]|nr:unnamed protein product [Rhizophagus irregularis]